MKKVSWIDRLRYGFDNTLSRGPVGLIGWLALLSLILVLISAVTLWKLGGSRSSLLDQVWRAMMQTLDPSGIDRAEGNWSFLLIMLLVTFGGIFITSTLIGILTAGIEERIDALRRGRSRVIETGHTVILGWSEQVYPIISELIVANANQRRSTIVLMGKKDKVEMENEIREKIGATGRTRIVCRTGDPIDLDDLAILSLPTSRSIIILSPRTEDPDSRVIKTMLAITNSPTRRNEPYHIVAEIRDPNNLEAARIVGQDEVELVQVGDLIARVIAQTCRQSGLSIVYTELLDFSGDEIYFQCEPSLEGKTYGEALLAYEDSAVIGVRTRERRPTLNPPMETILRPGDEIVAISQDDDTIVLSGKAQLGIQTDAIQTHLPSKQLPEHTLILGWNWRAPLIINELDHYVEPGSTVKVMASFPEGETVIAHQCTDLQNQSVTFMRGDTTDRRTLDDLDPESYDHVIVLCYSDLFPPQQADSYTLITLLHLRDIAERSDRPFSIVSEMMDIRNRNLAEVARADDFIVSDRLVSLMLSQVSEHKALNAVFADIFDPDGSEIYLKPIGDYVQLGRPLNFYTAVEAACLRGETAFGYRLQTYAEDKERAYGVLINPDKSELVTFKAEDRIIVLAKDD
jgi:voltage-gated potassium channel Kch